jgi:hypothetical protein
MTTSYPGSLDALTNPLSTDTMDSPDHATQHANANDAIEAIEAMVGLSGTSFPASPSSGDKFYRTDLHAGFYYDGTRWLSLTLFSLDFSVGKVIPSGLTTTSGFSVTDGLLRATHPGFGSFDIYLTDLKIATHVATTNNGTNFWAGAIATCTSGTRTFLANAFDTSAQTAGQWGVYTTAINSVVSSTIDILHIENNGKTGTPGALSLGGCSVAYRRVG